MKKWFFLLAAIAIVAVLYDAENRTYLRGFAARYIPAVNIPAVRFDAASGDEAMIATWQKAPGFYWRKFYVQDGDTLVAGERHIRLLCIDAPEREQDYGDEAQEFLAQLVKGGADIRSINEDQYGRILAVVIVEIDGSPVIANYEMLRGGYAWAYRQFAKNCGLPEDALYAMEDKAKKANLGLWQHKNPTPPWQYRHQNRQ